MFLLTIHKTFNLSNSGVFQTATKKEFLRGVCTLGLVVLKGLTQLTLTEL